MTRDFLDSSFQLQSRK